MIYLGADHAGFSLKEELKTYLRANNYEIGDLGTDSIESVDYPDFALAIAKKVAISNGKDKGILICGSGNGMCMTANKIKGIKAAIGYSLEAAKKSREDNNSNILCLAGWYLDKEKAKEIVDIWLKTEFSKENRHIRRINKILSF